MQKSYRLFGLLKAAGTAPVTAAADKRNLNTTGSATMSGSIDLGSGSTRGTEVNMSPVGAPSSTYATSANSGASNISFSSNNKTQAPAATLTSGNVVEPATNRTTSSAPAQLSGELVQANPQQNPAPGAITMGASGSSRSTNNQQQPQVQPQVQPQSGTVTFKGGHAVRLSNPDVDWSTPERGATTNNVKGTFLTDQQYAAYTDVANQLRANGVPEAKAKEYAIGYIRDQQNIARGGQANFDGRYYGNIQPKQKAQAPVEQPQAPSTPQAPAVEAAQTDNGAPSPQESVTPSTSDNAAAAQPQVEQTQQSTPYTTEGLQQSLRGDRTNVAEGFEAIPGRQGMYRKKGDKSGTIYDHAGRAYTHKGQVVTDALLRGDTDWWLPGYGHNIMHNIEQFAQREGSSIYNDTEMAKYGFEPVPGHKGQYYNPLTDQYADAQGNVHAQGTTVQQLPTSRTMSMRWQKDTSDPLGLWYDGSKSDIGLQF